MVKNNMENYTIKSRNDLKRYKKQVLKEIQMSSKTLKDNFVLSFSPQIKTSNGKKWDYNKLINYALIGYKSFIWIKRMKSLFKNNKKYKKKR